MKALSLAYLRAHAVALSIAPEFAENMAAPEDSAFFVNAQAALLLIGKCGHDPA